MVQNVPKWLKRFKITWMAESSPKIQSPSLFRIAENWLETQFLLLLSNHQAWTLIIKSLRWYLHLWWTSWKWTLHILWLFDYLWSLMFFLSFLLSSINWLTSPAEIISIMTRTTHSWLRLMPSPPSSSILMFLPSIISIFSLLHHFEFKSFFIFQCRKKPSVFDDFFRISCDQFTILKFRTFASLCLCSIKIKTLKWNCVKSFIIGCLICRIGDS